MPEEKLDVVTPCQQAAGGQAGKSGCVADRRFVVRCKRAPYDVYVGRGRDPNTGAANAGWGNPFVIGRDGDRASVIAKHRAWFLS